MDNLSLFIVVPTCPLLHCGAKMSSLTLRCQIFLPKWAVQNCPPTGLSRKGLLKGPFLNMDTIKLPTWQMFYFDSTSCAGRPNGKSEWWSLANGQGVSGHHHLGGGRTLTGLRLGDTSVSSSQFIGSCYRKSYQIWLQIWFKQETAHNTTLQYNII